MAADNTSDLNALDKICDDYEQSLPDHTDFPQTLQRLNSALERAPQSLQHTLLQLLLELEFEHRLMNNQPCPHSELLQHFPNFSPSIENALAAARQRTGLAGTLQMPTAAADSQSSPAPPTPPAPQNLPLTPAPSAPPHAQPHPSHPHSHASLWCVISGDGVVSATDNSWDEEIGRDFIVGTLLQQRFLVTDVLGRGGMGCVLLARDQILHRDVAVKVLLRKPSHSSSQLHESLSREAQLAASLNHRGIAVVHDFGSHAGRSFTVFEYVRGRTLRALLDECRTFTPEQTRSIILELADALDAAHAAGVIHQDLKPENICITLDGQPKILDFGVARHLSGNVASRGFFGTPLYASPEQAACSATDGRTDQYALALLAFEMLSGQRVFPSGSPLELLRQHREITPPRLDSVCSHLPVQTANSIHRALAKRPTDRFATCREFAEAAFPQPATTATPANIPTVPEAERLDVFLCQVAPNSLFARRLAEFLQRYGLKTWYYQHDASPGVSFLKQTTDAIQRSRTVLLIISPAALISEDFALQLQAATERRRTLLPLLLDISPEDFERRQPAWRALLGPAALLDLNGIDQKNAFPKVLQRLQLAGLAADHHRHTTRIPSPNHNSTRPSHHSATQGQVWATDSSQIDADDLPQLVFQNELVEEFLSRRNRYFLSGTKGLGKTLLLSYKRQLIANRAAEGDRGAASTCLIPHSGSRLDLMHEMRTVSEHFESSLAELSVTKRFWSTALRISAISHYDGHIAPDEKSELLAFPERFRRWLLGAKVAPSVVFKELTNLSVGQAKSLVDNTETFLDEKLRSIHNPTCFFVDKVDQAIRERSREAWIHIQAGLIEAAWEIMNSN
ncbi:MAG: Serine/threonine-protein kinase PrkC, partial [Planctomycetota bacterium]